MALYDLYYRHKPSTESESREDVTDVAEGGHEELYTSELGSIWNDFASSKSA